MLIEKKFGLDIVAIIVAGVACIASIRSCSIARDAVNTSMVQFSAENRPYLVVSPEKFKDSRKYCEIEKIDDVKVRFHVQFKIQNIGNSSAIDISSPGQLQAFDKGGKVNVSSGLNPPIITLGPGEHIYRNYNITFSGNEPGWAEKTISELTQHGGEISVIWFELRYQNEVDNNIQYQTKIAYALSVDSVRILTKETNRILLQ